MNSRLFSLEICRVSLPIERHRFKMIHVQQSMRFIFFGVQNNGSETRKQWTELVNVMVERKKVCGVHCCPVMYIQTRHDDGAWTELRYIHKELNKVHGESQKSWMDEARKLNTLQSTKKDFTFSNIVFFFNFHWNEKKNNFHWNDKKRQKKTPFLFCLVVRNIFNVLFCFCIDFHRFFYYIEKLVRIALNKSSTRVM